MIALADSPGTQAKPVERFQGSNVLFQRTPAEPSPFRQPKVLLLIESSRAYGRGLLAGIADYIQTHEPWFVSLGEYGLCDDVSPWLEQWNGDGIITRIDNDRSINLVKSLDKPTVLLRKISPHLKIPGVLLDNTAAAQMGFEHLFERGFRHFAFCGFNGADYSDERCAAFTQSIAKYNLPCHVFKENFKDGFSRTVEFEQTGMTDQIALARWINSLPKPIGLMACNDTRGRQVLEACRVAGAKVPDDVAVIGVDNDEVLCKLSDPPLSSVVPDAERAGYEAASLLAGMMAGEKPTGLTHYIKPRAIIGRRSTETLAIKDRSIAGALGYIRDHACENILIDDIRRTAALPRSTFQRRFTSIVGRSAKEEILRVRLNCIKELLTSTNLSVETIAAKTGFNRPEYLTRIFKKKTGLTTSQFRLQLSRPK